MSEYPSFYRSTIDLCTLTIGLQNKNITVYRPTILCNQLTQKFQKKKKIYTYIRTVLHQSQCASCSLVPTKHQNIVL